MGVSSRRVSRARLVRDAREGTSPRRAQEVAAKARRETEPQTHYPSIQKGTTQDHHEDPYSAPEELGFGRGFGQGFGQGFGLGFGRGFGRGFGLGFGLGFGQGFGLGF